MNEAKNRIIKAIEKYQEKQLPKESTNKKNKKPEEKVVKEILEYFRSLGFSLNVIEAKAQFNESTQSYRGAAVKDGFSDICGNSSLGLATYIEVKAKGRRSTLRDNQRDFLISKIETNCFAICADSVDYCKDVINKYKNCKSLEEKRDLLFSELPKTKHNNDSPLFDE